MECKAMKRVRGLVKQFLPFGCMRRFVNRKYHVDMGPKKGPVWGLVCEFLPFYFMQDREIMRSIGEAAPPSQKQKIRDKAAGQFEKSAKAISGGDHETILDRIVNKAWMVASGDNYQCVTWVMEKVVIYSMAFPGEDTLGKLSAVLHWTKLRRYIEMAGAHDGFLYRALGSIYNHAVDDGFLEKLQMKTEATPELTFIVPVYNAEAYLVDCLESLRRQSEYNIEIICVDDGSVDGSAEILDGYAAADSRFRVVHQKNSGVSSARNRGLDMARGRYVAFVDGDDRVELDLAQTAIDTFEAKDLDIFFFDFRCFDTRNRKVLYAYWSICNHVGDWIFEKVFSFDELPVWRFSVSASFSVIRRSVIETPRLRFEQLKLGEDALFMYSLVPRIKRAWCSRCVKYHYRKGNPMSAVARLSGNSVTVDAVRSRIEYLEREAALFRDLYLGRHPGKYVDACADRMAIDFKYHVRTSSEVREWFDASPYKEWFRFELPDTPPEPVVDKAELRSIEAARKSCEQDMYVVAGQIKGLNVDPIDSWTFFRWLQDHGIPSRYLVWSKSRFAERLRAKEMTKDVIFTKTDCRGDELLEYADIFARARAVVVEWQFHTYMDRWLRELPGCRYVFLQHGVIGTCLTEPVRAVFHGVFNDCNVSSERERALIDGPGVAPGESELFIGGLPRYDLLRKVRPHRTGEPFTVLVMFTWRESLNKGGEYIKASAYWQGLTALLSEKNRKTLAESGVELHVALHHSLMDHVHGIELGDGVSIVGQEEISNEIRNADGLVTDFSSVSCDFMFQHKPTVFWIPDADDPLLDRANHQDGGKVDSALSLQRNFYNICSSPADVVARLEHYAADGFRLEPDKVAVADTYFDRGCPSFSQRVYERIEERLKRGAR